MTGLGVTGDGSRLLVTSAGAAYAYDTASGRRVSSEGLEPRTEQQRLDGSSRAGVAVPRGFELAGWAGTGTFYGTTVEGESPGAVVSCSLATRTCARLAAIEGPGPVVFGTGRQGAGK